MRKTLLAAIAATATATSLLVAGDSEIPHSFKRGTVIDPDEMNANFSALADGVGAVADRVTELENAEPPELNDQSVTSSKLADGAVITSKLATGAVTTPAIADSAITAEKLAPGAVTDSDTTYTNGDGLTLNGTTFSLSDAGVTNGKLAGNAVTADKLASNAVTSSKLADGVVTSAKLADSAVTSAKIANGAVTGGKLAANSVSPDKLANPSRPLLVDYAEGTLSSVEDVPATPIDHSLTVPADGKILITVAANLSLRDVDDDGFVLNFIDVWARVGTFGGGDNLAEGSSHRGSIKASTYAWSATRSFLIDAKAGRSYLVEIGLDSSCVNCELDAKYNMNVNAMYFPGT